MSKLLWQPTSEQTAHTHMTQFSQQLQQQYHLSNTDYSTIHQWSIDHPELFWEAVWKDCDIIATTPYSQAMGEPKMPGTTWFEGARLNFAENLLRYRDTQTAILFYDERGRNQSLTYQELAQQVARCAEGFREHGVRVGDRVAAVIPNCPEAIIAALATASLGAIWSSCSPDFGLNGIYDRLGQIEPKLLITVDGYAYNGKPFDCLEKTQGLLEKIDSIQHAIIIPFLNEEVSLFPKAQRWSDLLDTGDVELSFEALPFDHPLYIMYSSGTTGVPKSIVHGAGGTLIQHLKEHRYHCNLRRESKLFFFTTCGWMMWNWLISGLASGSTLVLYEGSPSFPDLSVLWKLTESHQITHFGTSPKFLTALKNENLHPGTQYDLRSLQCLMSTGAPLSAELFEWVYEHLHSELQIASICGGTDIISCFILGNPNLPVYAGEIQCKGLGMDVHAYNAQHESVLQEKGELICRTPFPSMPIYFWNDADGQKYHKAYFQEIEGIWHHGDFIEVTEYGGVIVYGRSDTTLNPGGVRIGTAEIYRQVESLPEIADSIVVGQKWEGDVRIVLFVVLQAPHTLDDALISKIKTTLRTGASPKHVPALIRSVPEVPRTISGKKVEKAVAQILDGEAVLNKAALANPKALEAFG